jgi:hypothetical protein
VLQGDVASETVRAVPRAQTELVQQRDRTPNERIGDRVFRSIGAA